MALTRVQGTAKVIADNATTLAITLSTLPTVGNALIVPVSAWGGSGFPTGGCTDNRGNTYQRAVVATNIQIRAVIYYCAVVTASAAPFTITVTPTGNTYMIGSAIEVSGGGTGLVVDQTSTGVSSGADGLALSGATPALTASEVVLVGSMGCNTSKPSIVIETLTPAWTQEVEELSNAHAVGETDTRIVTGATGTTPSAKWTLGGADSWAAALVALAASAPAVAATARVTQAPVEVLAQGLVAVPAVVGLSLADATTALTGADLTVGALTGDPAGLVTVQTPSAGTAVAFGSSVALTLVVPTAASVRVTQAPIEILLTEAHPLRLTQLAVEVFFPYSSPARLTQQVVEYLETRAAATRVSSVAVEVFIRDQPRRLIRRLRRAPHVSNENRRITYARFALDLQRGIGALAGPGVDPVVTLRLSRDGGQTWGEPVTMHAGTLGASTTRVLARRLGHARDAVFEVSVSDPVAWSLVQAWLHVEPGRS